MKIAAKIAALTVILLSAWKTSALNVEVVETASIRDTATSIMGINHIGLSVKDLDAMLEFYRTASSFELVSREKVSGSKAADTLYGREGIEYEVAVLKAPNMLLELTQFKHNAEAEVSVMPPQGPGMTHTCFQSPISDSGWDKFIAVGIEPLSRGGQPIDLGGYGVTYGYAYDPEGNMVELEQLDGTILARAGYDSAWQDEGEALWMSQVALATHDIEGLMAFYENVLGIKPYRTTEASNNVRMDEIVDIDDLELLGGWFKMNETSKVIEIWQYINPITEEFTGERDVTDLGYTFSLEVGDIHAEVERLQNIGLEFVGAPVQLGGFWQAYTRDRDGNVFSLRQAVDADSQLSVRVLDAKRES